MENKYENIDPQNEQIFNLIQEEFQKENIQDEIKLMVTNRIKSTDFNSFNGLAKFGTSLSNGLYYMLGVVIVAGSLSLLYFTSNNNTEDKQSAINETEQSQIKNNADVENEVVYLENQTEKSNNDLIVNNDSKSINKRSQSEILSIESQEFQHSQTLTVSNELSSDYVQNSFSNIFNNLNLDFKEKVTEKSVSFVSKRITGQFDDKSVEYSITLKFSNLDKYKIIAVLNYKEIPQKSLNVNVNEIFYESLISELQKYF